MSSESQSSEVRIKSDPDTPRKSRVDSDSPQKSIESKLDINQIKKAILEAENIIKASSDSKANELNENVGILWGFSGTGKSTAAVILSGRNIMGYHIGDPIIVEQNPSKSEMEVRIQIKMKAGTIYPAKVQMRYKQKEGKVILWDMPGLGENRGITQSLINSYFIHRIFEFHKQIKLIFTIDYIQLTPGRRGAGLKQTLKDMMDVLGKFEDYHRAVALMITKVPTHANQDIIFQFIKQSLQYLPQIKYNIGFEKFFRSVISKNIELLLVKAPILGEKQIKLENKINVTNQYNKFIQRAYQIIAKLKATTFPKLESPAMSKEQILKCKPFINETKREIEKQLKLLCQKLPEHIKNIQSKIVFAEDIKKVGQQLQNWNRITKFVDNIIKIINFDSNDKKQMLKQRFYNLQAAFQRENFLCNQKHQCEAMNILNNQYIIVRFLLSLNFKQPDLWKQQSEIHKELFNRIKLLNIKNIWEGCEVKINTRLKQFINKYIQQQFTDNLQNQSYYKSWAMQYKLFPSFIQNVTKFDRSKDSLEYFNKLYNMCKNCKIQKSDKIEIIIEILKLNQKFLTKKVPQDFINSQIKIQIKRKGDQLIKNGTKDDDWTADGVQNVLPNYSKDLSVSRQKNKSKLPQLKQLKKQQPQQPNKQQRQNKMKKLQADNKNLRQKNQDLEKKIAQLKYTAKTKTQQLQNNKDKMQNIKAIQQQYNNKCQQLGILQQKMAVVQQQCNKCKQQLAQAIKIMKRQKCCQIY